MISIKSFKKGDWFSFSLITEKDEGFYIDDCNRDLCCYFKTNDKCVIGQSNKYKDNRMKYWFEIEEDELINVREMTRKELIDLYSNYDLQIHKFYKKDSNSWKDYERSKKDYNWKYEMALGINKSWVLCKKVLLDAYLKDLEEAKKTNNKLTIKYTEEALENLISGLNTEMKSKSTFISGSPIGSIEIQKNKTYFDAMLKNYAMLSMKYHTKVDSDFYYMIMDFEKTVLYAKAYMLSQPDIEIVTLVMRGVSDLDFIAGEINASFKLKKPLTKNDVKYRIDEEIPGILFKAEDKMNKKGIDCDEK